MKTYEVDDSDNIPKALLEAVEKGKKIYVGTAVGWLLLSEPEFLCGVTYGVLEEDNCDI